MTIIATVASSRPATMRGRVEPFAPAAPTQSRMRITRPPGPSCRRHRNASTRTTPISNGAANARLGDRGWNSRLNLWLNVYWPSTLRPTVPIVSIAATGPAQSRPLNRTAAMATVSTTIRGMTTGRNLKRVSSSGAPDDRDTWATHA